MRNASQRNTSYLQQRDRSVGGPSPSPRAAELLNRMTERDLSAYDKHSVNNQPAGKYYRDRPVNISNASLQKLETAKYLTNQNTGLQHQDSSQGIGDNSSRMNKYQRPVTQSIERSTRHNQRKLVRDDTFYSQHGGLPSTSQTKKQVFNNGESYEGEWLNSKMHGYGIYTFKDSTRYEGQFQNGKQHGLGTYYNLKNEPKQGSWADGKFINQNDTAMRGSENMAENRGNRVLQNLKSDAQQAQNDSEFFQRRSGMMQRGQTSSRLGTLDQRRQSTQLQDNTRNSIQNQTQLPQAINLKSSQPQANHTNLPMTSKQQSIIDNARTFSTNIEHEQRQEGSGPPPLAPKRPGTQAVDRMKIKQLSLKSKDLKNMHETQKAPLVLTGGQSQVLKLDNEEFSDSNQSFEPEPSQVAQQRQQQKSLVRDFRKKQFFTPNPKINRLNQTQYASQQATEELEDNGIQIVNHNPNRSRKINANRKTPTHTIDHQTLDVAPEPQIEEIENRLALMKVCNAIKSKYSTPQNFSQAINSESSTTLKLPGISLSADQLKQFLLQKCSEEVNARRVTDNDIETFLKAFGYDREKGKVVSDVDYVASVIYQKDQQGMLNAINQKRVSNYVHANDSDNDEHIFDKIQTAGAAANKRTIPRNKVDFEPEKAQNSKKGLVPVQQPIQQELSQPVSKKQKKRSTTEENHSSTTTLEDNNTSVFKKGKAAQQGLVKLTKAPSQNQKDQAPQQLVLQKDQIRLHDKTTPARTPQKKQVILSSTNAEQNEEQDESATKVKQTRQHNRSTPLQQKGGASGSEALSPQIDQTKMLDSRNIQIIDPARIKPVVVKLNKRKTNELLSPDQHSNDNQSFFSGGATNVINIKRVKSTKQQDENNNLESNDYNLQMQRAQTQVQGQADSPVKQESRIGRLQQRIKKSHGKLESQQDTSSQKVTPTPVKQDFESSSKKPKIRLKLQSAIEHGENEEYSSVEEEGESGFTRGLQQAELQSAPTVKKQTSKAPSKVEAASNPYDDDYSDGDHSFQDRDIKSPQKNMTLKQNQLSGLQVQPDQVARTEQNFFHHEQAEQLPAEEMPFTRKIETSNPEMQQSQKMRLIHMNSGSLSPTSLQQQLPTIEQEQTQPSLDDSSNLVAIQQKQESASKHQDGGQEAMLKQLVVKVDTPELQTIEQQPAQTTQLKPQSLQVEEQIEREQLEEGLEQRLESALLKSGQETPAEPQLQMQRTQQSDYMRALNDENVDVALPQTTETLAKPSDKRGVDPDVLTADEQACLQNLELQEDEEEEKTSPSKTANSKQKVVIKRPTTQIVEKPSNLKIKKEAKQPQGEKIVVQDQQLELPGGQKQKSVSKPPMTKQHSPSKPKEAYADNESDQSGAGPGVSPMIKRMAKTGNNFNQKKQSQVQKSLDRKQLTTSLSLQKRQQLGTTISALAKQDSIDNLSQGSQSQFGKPQTSRRGGDPPQVHQSQRQRAQQMKQKLDDEQSQRKGAKKQQSEQDPLLEDSVQSQKKPQGSRLFNTETVASRLKRLERQEYEAKQKEIADKKIKKKMPAKKQSVNPLRDSVASEQPQFVPENEPTEDEPNHLEKPKDSKVVHTRLRLQKAKCRREILPPYEAQQQVGQSQGDPVPFCHDWTVLDTDLKASQLLGDQAIQEQPLESDEQNSNPGGLQEPNRAVLDGVKMQNKEQDKPLRQPPLFDGEHHNPETLSEPGIESQLVLPLPLPEFVNDEVLSWQPIQDPSQLESDEPCATEQPHCQDVDSAELPVVGMETDFEDQAIEIPPLWDGDTPEPEFYEENDLMPKIMVRRRQREIRDLEVIPEETSETDWSGNTRSQRGAAMQDGNITPGLGQSPQESDAQSSSFDRQDGDQENESRSACDTEELSSSLTVQQMQRMQSKFNDNQDSEEFKEADGIDHQKQALEQRDDQDQDKRLKNTDEQEDMSSQDEGQDGIDLVPHSSNETKKSLPQTDEAQNDLERENSYSEKNNANQESLKPSSDLNNLAQEDSQNGINQKSQSLQNDDKMQNQVQDSNEKSKQPAADQNQAEQERNQINEYLDHPIETRQLKTKTAVEPTIEDAEQQDSANADLEFTSKQIAHMTSSVDQLKAKIDQDLDMFKNTLLQSQTNRSNLQASARSISGNSRNKLEPSSPSVDSMPDREQLGELNLSLQKVILNEGSNKDDSDQEDQDDPQQHNQDKFKQMQSPRSGLTQRASNPASTLPQDEQLAVPSLDTPLAKPSMSSEEPSQISTQTPAQKKKRRYKKLDKQLKKPESGDQPLSKPPLQDLACQANFSEEEEDDDGEKSDQDDMFESTPASSNIPNMVDCGMQTSKIHFDKIAKKKAFKAQQADKAFSTDWSLSSIYDDLQWKRLGKTQHSNQGSQFDGGNQVEEMQISSESTLQILSQIECEYNAEMLKHKQVADNEKTSAERCFQLYILGLNTLQALMYVMRLQKEWEHVTKPQYHIEVNLEGSINAKMLAKVDESQCIKLLIRCKKMYEARQAVQKILQSTIERDELNSQLKLGKQGNFKTHGEFKKSMQLAKRLGTKIAVQVNNLQDEHRIMKRPFIIRGREYLLTISEEQEQIESEFSEQYFVDETGTAGDNYQPAEGKQ